MQALSLIEALIKAENTEVLHHFARNNSCVYQQLNSAQASIKEKAKKVLELVGAEAPDSPTRRAVGAAPPSQVAASPAPATDLLGLDDGSANVPAPPPSSQAAEPDRQASPQPPLPTKQPSLLDDLDLPSPSGGALFAGMQTMVSPTPASQSAGLPEATSGGGGLFGGLSLADSAATSSPLTTAPVPTPAPTPPSAPAGLSALDELMASTVSPTSSLSSSSRPMTGGPMAGGPMASGMRGGMSPMPIQGGMAMQGMPPPGVPQMQQMQQNAQVHGLLLSLVLSRSA